MGTNEREMWADEFEGAYDAFDVPEADNETSDEEEPLVTAPTQLDAPAEEAPAEKPERPAEERLAELFARMPTRRKVLLGILGLCRERQAADELPAKVDELQARNQSVFTGATLVGLLEQAGGLKHINEDGSDYVPPAEEPAETDADAQEEAADEQGEQESCASVEETPVEADAAAEDDFEVEYLEVEAPEKTYWIATEAGLALVDADDPRRRLLELLETDAVYRPVYREILETMADGPMTKPQIDVIVKASPLTQEPRRLGGYFVDRLEKVDAIAWEGAWAITDLGREALELEQLYE